MIPKRQKKEEDNTDAWLMTYADMITLLLCFFIIFVSVSEPKKDKLSEIAEGVRGKFGAVEYETPFMAAQKALETTVETRQIYKDVAVKATSKSISLEIGTARFFTDGGADIDPNAKSILVELVQQLKKEKLDVYTVVIESHTDDQKPLSGLFTNNWELSSVRAGKLAQYFVDQGFAEDHIKAVGYGSSKPKVPHRDKQGQVIEANRMKNQRIIIRLE